MPILDLGTLKIEVKVLTDDANKQFTELKKTSTETAKTVKTDWNKIASDLTSIGSSLTKYVTLPLIAVGAAAVKFSSDMTETTNKVNEVFDGNAKAVDRWASNSLRKMGLAKQSAMDYASAFGDLGSSMDLTEEKNFKYSTSLVQLAADMASFKNISADRAQIALTGIYTGETESLKALGIVMTDANLQAYALANGYAQQYSDMSQAEKVTLRYEYVMDAAKNSMGDFARTSGGMANQTRMLGENAKETGAILGEVVAPTVNEIITGANDLLEKIKQLNPEARETVVTAALIAAGIGPLLSMIGKGIKAYNDISKAVAAANIKMQASAGVIGVISIAIGLLAAAVITAVGKYNDLTEAANELADANKKATDSIATSKQTLDNNLVAIEANAQMAQTYCDRLDELSSAETLSNAQRAEAKYLVDQLNETYPELNAQIDEQTGKIVGGTIAIRDQITAMQDRATAEAYEEQYTAVIQANADLTYAAAAAETERSIIAQRNANITAERTTLEQKFQAATGHSISAMSELDAVQQMALLDGKTAAQEMLYNYMKLGGELNDNTVSLRALDRELDKNKTATAAAEQQVAIATETYNKLTGATGALGDSLNETSGDIADTGEAAAEAEAKIKDYTDETINNFGKLPGAVKMSAAQATANLIENNATMAQWMSDLATLVDNGMDEGVVAKLYEMGPQFRSVVSDLIDSTPDEMKAFEDAMGASGDLSGKKFTTGVKNSTEEITNTLTSKKAEVDAWTSQTTTDVAAFVENGFIAQLNKIAPAWSAVIAELIRLNGSNLVVYKQSMLTSGTESGNNFWQGVKQATENKYGEYYTLGYTAGRKFVAGYNAAQQSKSPAKEGIKSGHNWMEGVTIGVIEDTNMLVEAAQNAARIPMAAMQAEISALPEFFAGTLPAQAPVYNTTKTATTNTTINRGKVEQHLHYSNKPMSPYEREIEQRRASRNLAKEVS
jgi:hypothetical protein